MLDKIFIFWLRISIGWMFFWAGITKIIDPTWSAEGYIKTAKNFSGLYAWFASPSVLPITNILNEWGLTLLGVAIFVGIFMRLSTFLGALLMLLYYFVILDFPYPNPHAFIIDEHVVYVFALFVLGSLNAGRIWGIENWVSSWSIFNKFPILRKLIG